MLSANEDRLRLIMYRHETDNRIEPLGASGRQQLFATSKRAGIDTKLNTATRLLFQYRDEQKPCMPGLIGNWCLR